MLRSSGAMRESGQAGELAASSASSAAWPAMHAGAPLRRVNSSGA